MKSINYRQARALMGHANKGRTLSTARSLVDFLDV
jgi:hypothetical protein